MTLHSSTSRPIISINNLHKNFGTVEVLKGVSFQAHEGEVISILGSSGSGKSTMLRCINMLEQPSDGEVIIDGEPIELHRHGKDLVPSDRHQVNRIRADVSMVFQSFNLWSHMTVLQNVIEGPIRVRGRKRAECISEAEELLHKVGIADRRHYYPSQLSGGQQQRAAIARALAMHPKALLFDEPTSALDPELVGEVLRVMRGLAEEGRTMLVVTHEMGFARDVSNRVLFLEKGAINCEGAPSQVFVDPPTERFAQFISRHI